MGAVKITSETVHYSNYFEEYYRALLKRCPGIGRTDVTYEIEWIDFVLHCWVEYQGTRYSEWHAVGPKVCAKAKRISELTEIPRHCVLGRIGGLSPLDGKPEMKIPIPAIVALGKLLQDDGRIDPESVTVVHDAANRVYCARGRHANGFHYEVREDERG